MATYELCYKCGNYEGRINKDHIILCKKYNLTYMRFASTDMDISKIRQMCPKYEKDGTR